MKKLYKIRLKLRNRVNPEQPTKQGETWLFAPQSGRHDQLSWDIYSDAGGSWRLCKESGSIGLEATAIIPTEWVSSFVVPIPQTQSRYINQLVPYLIEDQLTQPLDELHIVAVSQKEDSARAMVISRHYMQALADVFKQNGKQIKAIYVDADLLTSGKEQAHSETAQASCLAAHLSSGRALVKSSRGELLVVASVSQLPKNLYLEPINTISHINELELVRAAAQTTQAINLLAGQYKPAYLRERLQRYVQPAIYALVLIATLQIGYWLAVGSYYQQQIDKTTAELKAEFSQHFPTEPVIDLSRQLRAKQRRSFAGHNPSQVLPILAVLGDFYAQTASREKFTLIALRSSSVSGTTQLEIQLADVAKAEQLAEQLQLNQYVVAIDQLQQLSQVSSVRYTLKRIPSDE